MTYQVLGERDVEKISERQQELYQQNRARKRGCKTEEDIRDYQIWHMGVQEELDNLKAVSYTHLDVYKRQVRKHQQKYQHLLMHRQVFHAHLQGLLLRSFSAASSLSLDNLFR